MMDTVGRVMACFARLRPLLTGRIESSGLSVRLKRNIAILILGKIYKNFTQSIIFVCFFFRRGGCVCGRGCVNGKTYPHGKT